MRNERKEQVSFCVRVEKRERSMQVGDKNNFNVHGSIILIYKTWPSL